MAWKRLTSRRMLLLWTGLALLGAVLLLGELGCGTLLPGIVQRYENTTGPSPDLNTPIKTSSFAETVPASAPVKGPKEDMVLAAMNDPESAVPASKEQIVAIRGFTNLDGSIDPEKPGKGSEGKSHVTPHVWKRDRNRPSFARVYVGDGNSLELVSIQVNVTVEGPRARTVVDHIFRNPHDRQLEGTFEYPLPTGASPSYFAMFLGQTRENVPVRFTRRHNAQPLPELALARLKPDELVKYVDDADWGKLQEARVVAKDKALETYEDVVRGKVDPALLEYAGGNTFSGRVFPIPAKGYNRVILAYEETLPFAQNAMVYRFPLPDCKLTELQLNVEADESAGAGRVVRPAKSGEGKQGTSPFEFTHSWKDKGPGGDAVVTFAPPKNEVQAITGRQGENGPLYVYARVRPELSGERAESTASSAVFLLDTSLSEHPDRFGVSMKLLKQILEKDTDIRRFNVLTFDVGARWVEPKGWLENTAAGREKAFARLDGILLEGATDLSVALDKLRKQDFDLQKGEPLNVFLLSDGQITWGESDVGQLVAKFEAQCPFPTRFHCYRTGLGADNAELFEALTRRGGGVFNCFSEADLPAVAVAHRNQCFEVEGVHFVGGPAMSDVLIAGRKAAVYPGGELIVAARVGDDKFAEKMRTTLVVEGRYLGKKMTQEYTVDLTPTSELAARAWGEVAVASLLAVNDPKLDPLVTAYCQQFGIGSRVASFLVLENENDYKRLNLEEERGKTLTGDLASFLDGLWANLGKPASARQLFERFLAKVEPRVKATEGPDSVHVKRLLSVLDDADYELPNVPTGEDRPLPDKKHVPAGYLQARNHNKRDVSAYLAEARRRTDGGDKEGAARALSCIVEEYPGRADALRLVGYRLLNLEQPGSAARLFQQVERNRPFEPHSYRDMARSLEEARRYGLAALHYELLLAGTWHNRFHESLKTVAREEYVQMMQQALNETRKKGNWSSKGAKLRDYFGERLEELSASRDTSDLRVCISWNTDATDVDLWVIEPDGTKVFYSNPKSKSGGELSQDQTQGYGPERYRIAKAKPGVYKVIVHNFAPNPNLLGGETHVHVVITRHAGTPDEVVERHNVVLKTPKEEVEVARIKF
jgi:hypothetical protein